MHWKIEDDSENGTENEPADYHILPANSEYQHRVALVSMMNSLEAMWDQIEIGEKKSLTIELCKDETPERELCDNCKLYFVDKCELK